MSHLLTPLPPSLQGIVVKVLHERLGEKFYRKKGTVEEVKDSYTAVVRMNETGDIIKIDQAYLETVLPALGMYCTYTVDWPPSQSVLIRGVASFQRQICTMECTLEHFNAASIQGWPHSGVQIRGSSLIQWNSEQPDPY